MSTRKTYVQTVVGEEQLLLHSVQGMEALSQPFIFRLELLNHLDEDPIVPATLLGTTMCVNMEEAQSNDPETRKAKRRFHGHVTRLVRTGTVGRYRVYQADLQPWLWMLGKTSNCRVFQNMTVPDIVQKVFSKYSDIAVYKLAVTSYYKPRDYVVQYRETDLAFISRLLEHEGIYYYFTHEATKHTFVLADAMQQHKPLPMYEEIDYGLAHVGPRGRDTPGERINVWRPIQQVRSGQYSLKDYDFKDPKLKLNARLKAPKEHKQSAFELFDFPGGYDKTEVGDRYARIRLQEEQALFEHVEGDGNTHGLGPGYAFKLAKYEDESQNTDHVVLTAQYDFAINPEESSNEIVGRGFHCWFTALKATTQFRPERTTPRPVIPGLQTAKVVGPAGQEIWTDEYGRVKVQFPWDREGKFNDQSSCFIRVAQIWAGNAWGGLHVPRIGQEVVVSFLEGDPDQPLIVGCVYNGENLPPFGLPDGAHTSGVKTDSTISGDGGYNELSFADKAGAELIRIRAEKDIKETAEGNISSAANMMMDLSALLKLTASAGIEMELSAGKVKGATITLSAAGTITITGIALNLVGSTISLTAPIVNINSPMLKSTGIITGKLIPS